MSNSNDDQCAMTTNKSPWALYMNGGPRSPGRVSDTLLTPSLYLSRILMRRSRRHMNEE